MGQVLVVGSSNTDLVCRARRIPSPGETVTGSVFQTFAGGKGANQAVAAARAGATVGFVGVVGDDDLGRQRLADLAAEGVDVSRVVTASGVASGVALIVVDARGENQIVVVPGANGLVTPVLAADAVRAAADGVLLLQLEIPLEAVESALRERVSGSFAILNAAPWNDAAVDLLPLVDLLICNEIEAGALVGYEIDPESAAAAAVELLQRGCRSVAITLGRDGVVAADGRGVVHVPAVMVDAVDTTGAGDAFCGAVAARLADERPLHEALRAGVASAAIAVTRHGAQSSLPSRAEIDALLGRVPSA